MNNISGQFYSIIKDMYKKSVLCLKLGSKLTPSFKSYIGVKQGDVLSPNLFKLFLNDLPEIFASSPDPVKVNNFRVDCLLYADDIVLFSQTEKGLQDRMNMLQSYCSEWCLKCQFIQN